MATQRTRGGQFAAYLGPVLFIYLVFLIAPYLVLFRMSLNEFSSLKLYIPAFTFANYTTVLTEPYYLGLLARSFLIGILVSLVTLVMGLALAVYIASRGPLMKSLLMGAVLSPLLINLVVRTYAWLILLGDQGVINQWLMGWGITGSPLPINNNLFAVVIGLTHITLPLMVLSIVSVIETMPPNIIEAAESLGASRARVFRKVFIPQVMPGIAAGLHHAADARRRPRFDAEYGHL
jgi:putative spermidine/putrescine transport system permease protein